MDTIHINWSETVTQFDQIKDSIHSDLDKKGFYAILGATYNSESKKWKVTRLLYIGQAFDQSLRERIPQEHPAYQCVFKYQKERGVGIVVMIGIIEKSSVEKQTPQLFNDIECCLVFHNQPLCNTTCRESYSGRDIEVINTGHPYPLEKESTCSET